MISICEMTNDKISHFMELRRMVLYFIISIYII